jgi:hypothetical protein
MELWPEVFNLFDCCLGCRQGATGMGFLVGVCWRWLDALRGKDLRDKKAPKVKVGFLLKVGFFAITGNDVSTLHPGF